MIFVGTSGYNYPEWKGGFYPANLPMSKMLPYYAEHFSTVEINYSFVEINYSFYRMPSEKALEGWSGATPEGFAFTLKAPRRITHEARLRDCDDLLQTFGKRARTLGPKLGTLLFQLPPSFRKDLEALNVLLDWVPPDIRVAMEFRHDSWHSDDVFQRLKDTNVALCIADNEKGTTPLVATAGHGYFRLRDEGYQEADIDRWADTILEHETAWEDTFVYFKQEEEGKGAMFAQSLGRSLEART